MRPTVSDIKLFFLLSLMLRHGKLECLSVPEFFSVKASGGSTVGRALEIKGSIPASAWHREKDGV
jgi:hypothetical protein